MPKTILVGIGKPECCAAAVSLGVRWAQRYEALLVGLAVADVPALSAAEPLPIGGSTYKHERDEQLGKLARHEIEQYLEQFAILCAREKVAYKLLEDVGRPAEQIVLESQRYDLVLTGQRMQFQFGTFREEYGALRSIVRSAPRPVVVVPDHSHQGRNLVVAYDGSTHSARALGAFVATGLDGFGECHVIAIDRDRVTAARQGDRAVEFLRSHGLEARLHAIESADPASQILGQIVDLDAGLVVMGAYGHSSIRDSVLGSTTRTLLDQSSAPLFLFH